jgi:hypothetical protein
MLATVAKAREEAYELGERLLLWVPTWRADVRPVRVLHDEEQIDHLVKIAEDLTEDEFKAAYLSALHRRLLRRRRPGRRS